MKKIVLSTAALVASASAGLAQIDPNAVKAVPEISALEGVAAVALLAAVVALVWERRRRAI